MSRLARTVTRIPIHLGVTLVAALAVAALSAGCRVLPEGPSARAMSLSIENVAISYYVDAGTGGHTVQPGATFTRGDTVWLYFEVYGPAVWSDGNGFEVWVKVSELSLFGPGGTMESHRVDSIEVHEAGLEEAPTYVWLFAYARTDGDAATGQYRWDFEVTDALSGATATGTAGFTLR